MITNQDIYDHIIGSGALTYSWYTDAVLHVGAHGDAVWSMTLSGEDPEDSDETVLTEVTATSILGVCYDIVQDVTDNKYGVSERFGVARETRREAQNLLDAALDGLEDDTDFNADTADQVLQVLLYGEVIFG